MFYYNNCKLLTYRFEVYIVPSDLHEAATGAFASDNGGTSLTGTPSCTDSFKMFNMFLTHSIYLSI